MGTFLALLFLASVVFVMWVSFRLRSLAEDLLRLQDRLNRMESLPEFGPPSPSGPANLATRLTRIIERLDDLEALARVGEIDPGKIEEVAEAEAAPPLEPQPPPAAETTFLSAETPIPEPQGAAVLSPPPDHPPMEPEGPKAQAGEGFSTAPQPPPNFDGGAAPSGGGSTAAWRPKMGSLEWEQFMGVKLFAWVGGFFLFLAGVYFVKYSIDHDLISPWVRVLIGYVVGTGLIGSGLRLRPRGYEVTVQALCGAGVAILYADVFACRTIYQFFSTEMAFLFMGLVTFLSFLLAVRLDSKYIAILGLVCGFLTPPLLSTGVDRPVALFSYIAILDLSLAAVALRKRWAFLILMTAGATWLMEAGWTLKFFHPQKALLASCIYLFFCGLLLGVSEMARRRGIQDDAFHHGAGGMALASMLFVANMLRFDALGTSPWLVFLLVFLMSLQAAIVALEKRLGILILGAAAGVLLIQAAWSQGYFSEGRAFLAFCIHLFFCAFFFSIGETASRRQIQGSGFQHGPPLVALGSMFLVLNMLRLETVGARPWLSLTLLLLLSLTLAALACRREEARPWHMAGGGLAFLLLLGWTWKHLTPHLLHWGLLYYLAFGVLHAAVPVFLQRIRPTAHPFVLGYLFPLFSLALVVISSLMLHSLSFLLWLMVVPIAALVLFTAWIAALAWVAVAGVILTMALFGVWLLRLPAHGSLSGILFILALFSVGLFAWGLYASRKPRPVWASNARAPSSWRLDPVKAEHLPALSALLPFLLLAVAATRVAGGNPSEILGLVALLLLLLLGLVRYGASDALALIALGCTALVEVVWHISGFEPGRPILPILWYVAFYGLFAVFPFLFQTRMKGIFPWMAAALAGPVQFLLLHQAITVGIGKAYIGVLPALFAVPSLLALYRLIRTLSQEDRRRTPLLAWFGAVSLLFITLVIPLQFRKEWITVGWALEGVALIWLYRRVPHEGLKGWGLALLFTAFARLALNPAVLGYHPRAPWPVFNWYLYAYSIGSVCLILGARLLGPPKGNLLKVDVRPLLNALGTILAFLLLNIEIADYFSTGATLTFQFSGNLARDMTYSLGWALFAVALLVIGIRTGSRGARLGSLGLLVLTILKVAFHDLWRMGDIYRVASIVGLAVALIGASFLYQRFLGKGNKGGTDAP